MAWLSWIEDEDLESEVNSLLVTAINAKRIALAEFGKNVIDPFAAMFEISGFNISYDTWLKSETARQAQKTLQNHIGSFHQNILGKAKGDFQKTVKDSFLWTNMKVGNIIDLVSDQNKAIAEVKNKFNTISFGKLADLYYSFERLVGFKTSIYSGYAAYYVAIVPQNGERYNRPFTPSDKEKGKKCPLNELIREIDGASFYSLVTGSDSALEDLFDILPEVILACTNGNCKIDQGEKLKSFFDKAYKS